MNKLKGTGVALVTPFRKDRRVDFSALSKLVEHCIDGGIDYLVALGTTGESATLNSDEKLAVLETIKEANAGKLPLVLGIGGNDTVEVDRSIRDQDFDGIDAILSVSPYYNKPTQAGVIQHYTFLADHAPRPLILYNVPGRTGSNMTAETSLALSEHDNIVAIKEASGDMNQIMEIIRNKSNEFEVISGDDGLTLPILAVGGHGVISVVGQAFPESFSTMVKSALAGNLKKAKAEHYRLWETTGLLYVEGNPAGVKLALELQGMMESQVRMPLVSGSADLKSRLKTAMKIAQLI